MNKEVAINVGVTLSGKVFCWAFSQLKIPEFSQTGHCNFVCRRSKPAELSKMNGTYLVVGIERCSQRLAKNLCLKKTSGQFQAHAGLRAFGPIRASQNS
jgi:hypothetical protein